MLSRAAWSLTLPRIHCVICVQKVPVPTSAGMTSEAVVELNVPTGEPLVYELDDDMLPVHDVGPGGVKGRYLDPERAIAAASDVAKQAG